MNHARRDLCGGCAEMRIPTAIVKGRDQVAAFQEALLERPGIRFLYAGRQGRPQGREANITATSATPCVTENPKDVGCLQGCRRKSRVSWMHSSGWSSHGRWPASFITSQRAWGIIDAISFPRIADPSLS